VNPDYVKIGRILRSRGNRGEVKVLSEANSPEAFLDFLDNNVFLSRPKDSGLTNIRIEKAWIHKGFVILKFEGYEDITAAETLRDASVLVLKEKRPQLEEDAYYQDQLIGLGVINQSDNRHLGTVADVFQIADNTLLEVKKENGETFLVPFVRDIIHQVDRKNGILYATFPEGLDDL
jgi:16S rRNA processing protein RimM